MASATKVRQKKYLVELRRRKDENLDWTVKVEAVSAVIDTRGTLIFTNGAGSSMYGIGACIAAFAPGSWTSFRLDEKDCPAGDRDEAP